MCSADSHFHPFNSGLLFHHRCNKQLNECTKMHPTYTVAEILSSPLSSRCCNKSKAPCRPFHVSNTCEYHRSHIYREIKQLQMKQLLMFEKI